MVRTTNHLFQSSCALLTALQATLRGRALQNRLHKSVALTKTVLSLHRCLEHHLSNMISSVKYSAADLESTIAVAAVVGIPARTSRFRYCFDEHFPSLTTLFMDGRREHHRAFTLVDAHSWLLRSQHVGLAEHELRLGRANCGDAGSSNVLCAGD